MSRHVILVSLDTLRADGLTIHPAKLWPAKYETSITVRPHAMDRLSSEGCFFGNCITAAPYTSASHATYFTGRWPPRHGLYELFNRGLRAPTIFTRAHRFGYRTVFKTDFPLILGRYLGFTRDVDEYLVEDDEAALQALDLDRPTLAFLHFGGLHIPYGFHNLSYGGREYVEKVAELEAEIGRETAAVDRLVETYRDQQDLDLMLRYKRVIQHHYSRGNYSRLFSLYLEGLNRFFASRFGPFLDRLLEKLDGHDYLLVVFGDHGEEYDEDSYGHHNSLAEGVTRVPVTFYGPGVTAGTHLVRIRTVDIAPTILEAMGDPSARRLALDGRPLTSTVYGDDEPPPRPAFCQVFTAETKAYVRFQERLLRTGRKTGSLEHVRYQEAVYDGAYKLTRQNFQFTQSGGIWGLEPCTPRVSLEEVDPGSLVPMPASDAGAERDLLQLLDDYNRAFMPA